MRKERLNVMADSEMRSEFDTRTSERVLLCVRSERDRNLLAETLESKGHPCLVGFDHLWKEEIGLIVADRQTVSSELGAIRERIVRNDELFLPLLVLTTRSPRALGRPVREMADELVTMPSTKYEIGLSVRQLLRARSYSRDAARKRDRIAEQEENNRLLAEAVSQVGDKIVITDADGRIQYVNEAFEQLTGYAEEEVLGENPSLLNSGAQSEAFYERMWKTLHRGEDFRAEFVNERKDGTTYIEDQTVSPVRDEDGQITHFVSTGRDITERQRREEELRQAKRLFERVAEESPVSILIVQDGTYEYVNPAYEELSGYSRNELVGQLGPTDLVDPDRKDDLDADFARMKGNETERTQDETKLIRKNGESRSIRVYRSVVQFEGRESVMAVMVDISEEVRQREAREKIRQEIEQASEMKSALLQNMSHEIRTPLASIIGFADLLEGQLQKAGTRTEFAELIQNSGERLLNTLDNILRLAEIEGKEAEPQIEEVEVSELVTEVIDSVRIRAREKDLDLVVTLPDEPVKARIDSGAANQILSNLIDNALKFTREGRVEIALTSDAEELTFRIIDTGIGMDDSEIDQLLEPFRQRSVGLAREYEGTGLGLTIANKLTDRNGGHLNVESEPAKGTTVTVRLPRWADAAPRGPAHEWGLGSLPGDQRILAVDDDPSLLDLLAEMLPDSYEIDTVTTPDEALERAETGRYDLIFLDINLKDELDGTDLLDRMRAMDAAQHALMIAITAYAMPGDGDRFREQGFDGYVPKPFTYDTLRENLIQVFE